MESETSVTLLPRPVIVGSESSGEVRLGSAVVDEKGGVSLVVG